VELGCDHVTAVPANSRLHVEIAPIEKLLVINGWGQAEIAPAPISTIFELSSRMQHQSKMLGRDSTIRKAGARRTTQNRHAEDSSLGSVSSLPAQEPL